MLVFEKIFKKLKNQISKLPVDDCWPCATLCMQPSYLIWTLYDFSFLKYEKLEKEQIANENCGRTVRHTEQLFIWGKDIY